MPNIIWQKQFKAIEEERTQILRKEFKRAQLKMVAEYFKFQNYFSYSVSLLAFKASFYFDEPVKFVKIYLLLVTLFIPTSILFLQIEKLKKTFFRIEY
jgi:hypothetical protein